METKRYHADIFGKVQSVSFRNFTETIGIMLGVSGTVENKEEKHVEIYVEGCEDVVEVFLKAVTYGPRFARVDSILFTPEPVTGEIGKFKIIYPVVEHLFTGYLGGENLYIPGMYLPLQTNVCDICGDTILDKPFTFYDPESGAWDLCKPCHEAQAESS